MHIKTKSVRRDLIALHCIANKGETVYKEERPNGLPLETLERSIYIIKGSMSMYNEKGEMCSDYVPKFGTKVDGKTHPPGTYYIKVHEDGTEWICSYSRKKIQVNSYRVTYTEDFMMPDNTIGYIETGAVSFAENGIVYEEGRLLSNTGIFNKKVCLETDTVTIYYFETTYAKPEKLSDT
jgi:hypothetical protein